MKKFIITEDEKNRILGMHEDHGYNSLNEQGNGVGFGASQLGSDPKKNLEVLKAQAAKTAQTQKSDIKTTKFPCFTSTSDPYNYNPKRGDTVGNYAPAKMDFLRMFQDNAIIVAWENNTIKQYVRNGNSAGPETKKGTWKCKANNSGVDVVMTDSVVKKQSQKTGLKPSGTSTPNTKESSIGINYQYNYDGDTKYVYGVKDGKWFGKNLANGKEFDLSSIKTTVANLNKQFPNALTQQETPVDMTPTGTTLTATTDVVPKKLTDMSKLELDIMNQKQPLAFKSAYSKLGAFDRKKVDDNLAGK
jgi:hypothetical protein